MKLHPLLLIIIACGGGDSANAVGSDGGTAGGGDAGGVAITVEPQRAYVAPGGTQSFKCNVAGASDASCTWSVVGGAANGAITSAGVYTAPSTLGISQVIAASKAVPAATASAIVVVQSAATGKPGVWTNVTPRAVNLDNSAFNNSNFGVQDVIVDPVRPTDVYAFICFQGVWKSTDYGTTWTGPINTGAGGALVSAGKPWTAAIDPSPRDPATPPTLWTAAGDAAVGVLKSTDGGVSWTAHLTKNTTAAAASGDNYYANDAYALDVDPNDGKHLVTGFHQYPGISESFDGGVTWTTIGVPSNIGNSLYPFFIDSGAAATTRKNWLAVSQDGDNTGTWHTKDGGASWTQVGTFSHGHGDSQMWNVGSGVAYVGATGGVFKTIDGGQSFKNVSTVDANGVIATPTKLYATYGWADTAAVDPHLEQAARASDTTWSAVATPQGMTNGSKRLSLTFDGAHYILVGGFWNAGIWRYIE